jgi:hypothetical protein
LLDQVIGFFDRQRKSAIITAILILAFQARVNTRFTPTNARKRPSDVGANPRVRPDNAGVYGAR